MVKHGSIQKIREAHMTQSLSSQGPAGGECVHSVGSGLYVSESPPRTSLSEKCPPAFPLLVSSVIATALAFKRGEKSLRSFLVPPSSPGG